ncbi:MAG: type IV toxin-antitoxin system AbiEi family antitoxin domain-containing protein, partial [Stellaceae bacterium]
IQLSTLRHMPAADASRRLLRLTRRRGSTTRQEVVDAGIHTQTLSRLVRAGALERVSRGRYRLPDAPITEHHSLALVAAAAPKAVVCLLSALSFHQIGTQLPHEVWIAVDRRTRRPTLSYPRLRVLRFGGHALSEGIEVHRIEGETVRVYGVAKTIADVFKYRNKVGLDVALEALREAWRSHRCTMDAIHRYARICRVERVMRPYLEALVG